LDHISKHKVNVLSGYQVVNKNVLKEDKKLSASEIYNREKMMIDKADFIIAEVSKPSLGVGAEIVYALNEGKPVLAMVRTDYEDKISPMLIGNPSENLYLEYYRNQDFQKIIDKFVSNMSVMIKHKKILREHAGKLLVIEGGDGSGKTTQVSLLHDFFKKQHIPVRIVDFPQYYTSFHGNTVARFLRGEFGNIDQVSPYLASLSYALDRASIKKEMTDFLKKGGYLIANRYATSSMAHQAARFHDTKKQSEFLKWIYELEYKVHKIPKEDLVIYLYVPWKIAKQLTEKKGYQAYMKNKKKDISEKDDHRMASEKMYLKLADSFPHWITINCIENKSIMPVDKIHQKIIEILKLKNII